VSIITKIKNANLIGRGGAEFPVAKKWQYVKQAKGDQKYVVCNASEGEPGVFKDLYLLKQHPEQVFEGMRLAMDYLNSKDAVFNLNERYYQQIKTKYNALVRKYRKKGYRFETFREPPSYMGGEESALLNAIEGRRLEPRLKPPYPAEAGLCGCPTLINNVESFYNVALVDQGKFEDTRFVSIVVDGKRRGVHEVPASWSVKKVLKHVGIDPDFRFFVQIGGGVAGEVFDQKQIGRVRLSGAGSIEIYRSTKKPRDMLLKWLKFYAVESCGKCGPCRMGTYNLYELVRSTKRVPWPKILQLLDTMDETSFCPLGQGVSIPVRSYMKNVLGLKTSIK